MPKFVDNVSVQGAATISGDAQATTQILRQAQGQSAPFLEFEDQNGNILSSIDSNGHATGALAGQFDAAGAAATAQSNAEAAAHTDAANQITALGLGSASTHAATDFDSAGAAAAAQTAAESAAHTDAANQIAALGLGTASTHAATDFDAAGAAATAQSNAESYALTQAQQAQSNAESYSDAQLSTALAGMSSAESPAAAVGSGLTHSGIGQVIGGVTVTAGMRILDTANAVASGLWVAASGAWTRPTDFATGSNAQGKLVEVDNGSLWLCVSNGTVTVDTTTQVWQQIDASVLQFASGLTKSGNTVSLALTKALITATGLTYSDVNADQAGAAATAQANAEAAIPVAGSTTPNMDGTGSAGTATTWSKSDHVHPTDTSRAPVASPTFTGTPAAPTATAGTDNTQIATTAYVDGSYTPTTERVNSVGTSGSSQTIPAPQSDTINRIVLSANCALTFPSAAAGESFMLQAVQPSSGGPYSITWPGSALVWVAGSAPTQATAASKRDLYSFVCIDGTNWEGIQVSPSGGY